MGSYTIMPHTADVRLFIRAESLEDLFISALQGMNEILKKNYGRKSVKNKISQNISISADNLTTLLIDFLSNVLYFSQIEKAIFREIKLKKLTDNYINAIITGSKVDSFDEDIKAVTYHEAQVVKKNGFYETTVVFDI